METIIKINCIDEKGLIHKITGILYSRSLNVTQTSEFVDETANRFFMRVSFTGDTELSILGKELVNVLPAHAEVEIIKPGKKKVLILVTREHHCLGDLIIKSVYHDLPFDICGVIGNHETLKPPCDKFDIPFHFEPSTELTRLEHEAKLNGIISSYQPDLLVLAKYMQILTPEFTTFYKGRIINIHHSFLPAFIGANPYRQAFERGVKIIGATAHFVTDDLDEGPIICQEVISVNHSHSVKEMSRAGKEVEKAVLARALKLVLEDRVFIYQNKTILFD
jgi:formyltetrahydrofolate deformylase